MKTSLKLCILLFVLSCGKDDDNIVTPQSFSPTVKLNATYEVNITEDIVYAEGFSHDSWNGSNTTVVSLLMDSYVPDNNSQNRPMLLLIHGGAFVGGSKQQEALVDIIQIIMHPEVLLYFQWTIDLETIREQFHKNGLMPPLVAPLQISTKFMQCTLHTEMPKLL